MTPPTAKAVRVAAYPAFPAWRPSATRTTSVAMRAPMPMLQRVVAVQSHRRDRSARSTASPSAISAQRVDPAGRGGRGGAPVRREAMRSAART